MTFDHRSLVTDHYIMVYFDHRMPDALPQKRWYRTPGGVIFLIIVSVILVFVLVFGGLIAYYAWQLKFGNAEELARRFSQNMTVDASLAQRPSSSAVEQDIQSFIYSESPTFGNPDAPVTILMFIDFECPFCQAAFPIFKDVMQKYEPVIRVVFKHFPLASIHPLATQAGLAAQCAQDQGKFWEYYDILFERKVFAVSSLNAYANDLGLDANRFGSCLETKQHAPMLMRDFKDGVDLGARGTPTYIVNQRKVEGVVSREEWDRILLEEMQKETGL